MKKTIAKITVTSLLLAGFIFGAAINGQTAQAEEVKPQYDPGDGVRPD